MNEESVDAATPASRNKESCMSASTAPAPRRILMIGNSLTYYNNGIPRQLRLLAEAGQFSPNASKTGEPATDFVAMTISRGRLADHRHGFEGMLRSRPWDMAIMQGSSKDVLDTGQRSSFFAFGRIFANMAMNAGARPALYMAWPYVDDDARMPEFAAAYAELGEKTGALVIPAGLAMHEARRCLPDFPLIMADKIHPTPGGTYLVACAFYSAIYNASPLGLPCEWDIPADTVALLQRIAWESVTAWQREHPCPAKPISSSFI